MSALHLASRTARRATNPASREPTERVTRRLGGRVDILVDNLVIYSGSTAPESDAETFSRVSSTSSSMGMSVICSTVTAARAGSPSPVASPNRRRFELLSLRRR
jgi:hypothetical protein